MIFSVETICEGEDGFEISKPSIISLFIYDVLGNEIFKLIDNKEFFSSQHEVIWNGFTEDKKTAASGIYFYRLVCNKQSLSRSMILLK
ncbi:MAG TPA: gliding motility-associated C-terminal domain-containing protein [Ignavibacteriaceae bacterium]|nr:gliding motility-associated C-terminal domain-containing protein [Ignavibacteriaceae bacterium]